MQSNNKHPLLVAVEDEPFPRGPTGESCRLKLNDWLNLAMLVRDSAQLEICPLSEISHHQPDIVEAFSTRHSILTKTTFPSRDEHDLVSRFSRYWPAVQRAGVPAIGVIQGTPSKYPVFVRGEEGTFSGGGCIRTAAGIQRIRQTDRPLIVRPFVQILAADRRASVRMELRVHVVAGKAVAVEYLFPPWAAQKPTPRELEQGKAWVNLETASATKHAERIGVELKCRWFVADFAATNDGLQLIELNPGWCAGIAEASSARAVHVGILSNIFGLDVSRSRQD